MTYLLRRLPLSRLLLLCGLVLVLGISLTALAFALGSGPTPPPKPLPEAIHDALTAGAGGNQIQGVSARIQLTDHLLEGANLASGSSTSAGELSSSPLLTGASGRLWISKDGHVRLELQSERGDTQIYYDGKTVSMYDAASNTLYRYTPPPGEGGWSSSPEQSGAEPDRNAPAHAIGAPAHPHEPPSVAKIEEAISHLSQHADVSGATPTDIAGQAAYTVRVTPKETGSLLGGAELSWDAVHGVPLRAAIYSSTSSSPALELAATEISYGPVESSVFEFTPPANATVEEVVLPHRHTANSGGSGGSGDSGERPHVTTDGQGLSTIAVIEDKTHESAGKEPALPEGLQKVKINGVEAAELPTELGTLLSFERSGVRYFLAGAVSPAAVEAVARGL
jgi:outer membrane lipoprotein-sorting protein